MSKPIQLTRIDGTKFTVDADTITHYGQGDHLAGVTTSYIMSEGIKVEVQESKDELSKLIS